MGEHEAQAYKDPGTPEEQSRRTFLANATLGIGGIIGLTIAIPSLVGAGYLSRKVDNYAAELEVVLERIINRGRK